jgi:predicted PurR-regulated permease PerM
MSLKSEAAFTGRLLIIGCVVALFALLYAVRVSLLLIVGAVLLSVILDLVGGVYRAIPGVGRKLSISLAGVTVAGVLVTAIWLAGAQIAREFSAIAEALPRARAALIGELERIGLGDVYAQIDPTAFIDGTVGGWAGLATRSGRALFETLAVAFGGLFLALSPDMYRNGLLAILPPRARGPVDATLSQIGRALRVWLGARLVAMALVGALYWAALTWIGAPGALAVGVLGALLEFVAYLGPIAGGGLALLMAMTLGWEEVLIALVAVTVIQQLEGNIISPLIEQRAVRLPPALNVFTVFSMGVLFGPLGVMLASPTLLIVFVAVKELWVRGALNEETPMPGA